MKNWTEIKIAVDAADIDRAGDIANAAASCGIYIEDYRDLEQTVEEIAHIDLISALKARGSLTRSSFSTAPRRTGATTGKNTSIRSRWEKS